MKISQMIFSIVLLFFFFGCNESQNKHTISLLGQPKNTQTLHANNTNVQKEYDRKNQLEVARIQAKAQIEMAKIESKSRIEAASLQSKTQEKIAKIDADTKVKTAQLEIATKKESMKYTLYIAIAFIILLIIALILFYLNSKKNREIQQQLHKERLRHEQRLKEKELEEQRIHKLLELIGDGKLPTNVEEEVIRTISTPKTKLIEG